MAKHYDKTDIHILGIKIDRTFSSCLQKLENFKKISISETSKGLFPDAATVSIFVFWKQDLYSWYKEVQCCKGQKINNSRNGVLLQSCLCNNTDVH